MQAQATAVEAKMAGERALLETEKVKLQHQAALMQTEQKFQKQVQTTELVARRAESDVKSVAEALPRHQQYMEVLKQQVELTEGKMRVAEAKATQAVSQVQGAVEAVPEHSKQIQDLQTQLQAVLVTLEEQRLYTKGLEGDLQRANQRLLNTESTVKATRTANEAMQATVDYWSTFYEDENAATPSANPAAASSNVMGNTAQLPEIPQASPSQCPPSSSSNISFQPQISVSSARPQVSYLSPQSRPQDNFVFNSQPSESYTETSLAGWHGSNGAGSTNQASATFNFTIKPRDPPAFHGRATDDVIT